MADESADKTVENLDAEQSAATEDYLRLRDVGDDAKSKRELQRVVGKLDGLYWKRVGKLLSDRVAEGGETLSFSDEERLLVDVGLLDAALLDDASDGLVDRLLIELRVAGPPNHYYFSEWLEDRYRRFLLSEQMQAHEEEDESEESDSEARRLADARKKILSRLRPFFDGLPGVSPQLAKHIVSGRFDDQLHGVDLALLGSADRVAFMRRHNLANTRQQVLLRVRARLTDEKEHKLLDMLDVVYGKLWRERYAEHESGAAEPDPSATGVLQTSAAAEKAVEYMDGELKFAKSLLPIGALAGGVARCCSVLLEDGTRITKGATRRELNRVRQCDRGFTVDPVVVIAPFRGLGFYEWDRDSLFVPLSPVESPAATVAHASGNYRMMIDSLQQGGALKTAYEGAFEGASMRRDFQKDYRDWVAVVGAGNRDGMDPDHFRFFFDHIGPDCEGVLAPANLRNLGEAARKTLRRRLEKQLSAGATDANLHYRLGVLYWQEGRDDLALAQIARCVGMESDTGIGVFSLGLLLQRKGATEKATQAFNVCISRVPQSIWAVYARMAMEGEIS